MTPEQIRLQQVPQGVSHWKTWGPYLSERQWGTVREDFAQELAHRLAGIFLRDQSGRRPVYGGTEKFQTDPAWKDYLLFYEYFHGDNGAGLGASYQTSWTGLVAALIDAFGRLDAKQYLATGKIRTFSKSGSSDADHVRVA